MDKKQEWVMVPVEPTAKMLEAYESATIVPASKNGYKAMLAAAPQAPDHIVDADKMVASDVQGEPVGVVRTVGGYPDDSEHTVHWLCKHKDLKDGDYLYAAPQPGPDVEGLIEVLRDICSAYRQAIHSGYDRIKELNGDCDRPSKMLEDCTPYRKALGLLSTHQKQEEM